MTAQIRRVAPAHGALSQNPQCADAACSRAPTDRFRFDYKDEPRVNCRSVAQSNLDMRNRRVEISGIYLAESAAEVSPASCAERASHDTTLLIVSLEELETRRCAIEWLVEQDLLWRCLP